METKELLDTKVSSARLICLSLLSVITLSACTSIGYRCPLDPNEKPESATACASMHEAMEGARKGTGGRTSVFLDDKGRIVPPELHTGKAAVPLAVKMAEPYTKPSGTPAYSQPKVFQVWSSAFKDEHGNLHDGHHSWFATPGEWNYGTVNKSGVVGKNIMRPTTPLDRLPGVVVPTDRKGNPIVVTPQPNQRGNPQLQPPASAGLNESQQALNDLSNAAARQSPPRTASGIGITAPQVQLGN